MRNGFMPADDRVWSALVDTMRRVARSAREHFAWSQEETRDGGLWTFPLYRFHDDCTALHVLAGVARLFRFGPEDGR